MELRKNKRKLIVTKSEHESKISSNKDLHYILRQGCKILFIIKLGKYYIPKMNQWLIVYLIDVLSGKKRVNGTKNAKHISSNFKISNQYCFLNMKSWQQIRCIQK